MSSRTITLTEPPPSLALCLRLERRTSAPFEPSQPILSLEPAAQAPQVREEVLASYSLRLRERATYMLMRMDGITPEALVGSQLASAEEELAREKRQLVQRLADRVQESASLLCALTDEVASQDLYTAATGQLANMGETLRGMSEELDRKEQAALQIKQQLAGQQQRRGTIQEAIIKLRELQGEMAQELNRAESSLAEWQATQQQKVASLEALPLKILQLKEKLDEQRRELEKNSAAVKEAMDDNSARASLLVTTRAELQAHEREVEGIGQELKQGAEKQAEVESSQTSMLKTINSISKQNKQD